MTRNARRITGTLTAGLVLVGGAGLLLAPTAAPQAWGLALAGAVGIGAVQVLAGLLHLGGGRTGDAHVVDSSAWGAGWVLDGVRVIGLAFGLWMILGPSGDALSGWVLVAAAVVSQPFSARLDRRAAPRLRPGTYTVTVERAPAPTLPLVPATAPRRHLQVVRDAAPAPSRLHRVDTRL
jgi:hypothetical protein